ncbi:hypothetical protein [Kitasatospora sp. NPDC091207]|uniref:hypothetical protein n=1 Tax=Kitasatospora sp. NPDC091207 TaxID=3364083 RepID=UPI0037F65CAD
MTWSDVDRAGPDRTGPGEPWRRDPWPDDRDDPRMADAEVEDELRVLLRRAVPDLPTPDDRMDRVRERAARNRRRRRAAGLGAGLTGGLLAAALAAAPATAPSPGPTILRPATGGPTAAGAPAGVPSPSPPPTAASHLPSVSPSGVPSPSDGSQAVLFPELRGVILDVPRGWSTLIMPAGGPLSGTGFTANQPLKVAPYCPPWQVDCAPLEALNTDGVLVAVTLFDDPAHTQKLAWTAAAAEDTALAKDCGLRGGTRQLTGHRTVTVAGAVTVVELTACLNRPSARTVELVQRVVTSVRVTGGASVVATGSSHN